MSRTEKTGEEDISLASIADKLVEAARKIIQEAKTEEELKIK